MSFFIHPLDAISALHEDAPIVINEINKFTYSTFRTRGGRLGSGMGSLIEGLWVYYMNQALQNDGGKARVCELAWLPDHQPADFACLHRGAEWAPEARSGELFRIEAKSMNIKVEEAKGHFTNLAKETSKFDQLLVLVWSWTHYDSYYVWPRIHDYFIGDSLPIIRMRDRLHIARGGSFVATGGCPDFCAPQPCSHFGEPLNAAGKRERRSGPISTKPANVDHAANFGGLLRMIKTSNKNATEIFRQERSSCEICHNFISFIHKYYPNEELGQYKLKDWQKIAERIGLPFMRKSANQLQSEIANLCPDYRELLRCLA